MEVFAAFFVACHKVKRNLDRRFFSNFQIKNLYMTYRCFNKNPLDFKPISFFTWNIREKYGFSSFCLVVVTSGFEIVKSGKLERRWQNFLSDRVHLTYNFPSTRTPWNPHVRRMAAILKTFWTIYGTLVPSIFITSVHPPPPHAPRLLMWQYTGSDAGPNFKE